MAMVVYKGVSKPTRAAKRKANRRAGTVQQQFQIGPVRRVKTRPQQLVVRQVSAPPRRMRAQAAAAAYAQGQRASEPNIRGGFRSTRIQHRELVTNITGTVSYTVANSLALNPGIAATFPWLATQAVGWEQYKFHKLRFCYYTRTGTTTPGSMILAPDYDAADAAPATEQVACAYRDMVEEVPWTVEFSCNLDPKSMSEPSDRKYIRTTSLASNLDIKTYDSGTMFVCTTDGTAVAWGKLWVEYDVELFVPQLPPTGALTAISQHITGATPTSTDLMGTQTSVYSDSIVTVSGEIITFLQAGKFAVMYNASATTSIVETANAVAGSGGTLIATYVGNISSPGNAYGGSTTTLVGLISIINAVVGSTLTINQTIVAGLTAELVVTKLAANFT